MGRPSEWKDKGCRHCPAARNCPFPVCPEEEAEQERIKTLLMKQPASKQQFSFRSHE